MSRPGGRQAPAKTETGEVFQVPPEYIGQPGCTDAERQQFNTILDDGDIVDVFREQNPDTDDVFSWSSIGGMGGNGMRIDHCIASRSLLPHLGPVTVLSDCYMGSDHCPVMVTYKEKTELVIDVEARRESDGSKAEEANVEVNVDKTKEVNGSDKTKEK